MTLDASVRPGLYGVQMKMDLKVCVLVMYRGCSLGCYVLAYGIVVVANVYDFGRAVNSSDHAR